MTTSNESVLSKIIAFQMVIAGTVLWAFAFQYGWVHVFPHWVAVKGNPSLWQCFGIAFAVHFAFGMGYAVQKWDKLLTHGIASLINSGALWLVLWLAS